MTSRFSNFRIRETSLLAYTPSYPPTHGEPVDAAPLKLLLRFTFQLILFSTFLVTKQQATRIM